MSATPVLRIGTFGPRGVGKTVCLSALTLCRGGAGLELALRDAATIAYFRPLVEGLRNGTFPPATVPEMPRLVHWHADLGDRECDVQAADFAGELTDPIWNRGPEEFARAVADWFGACDGLLLFVDATAHDPGYDDALDKLLAELERHSTGHGSRRRAVGVLVTKADALPGATPDNITDPNVAGRLLAGHPIYQRVMRQVRRKSEALVYQLFLTSAVGWNFVRVTDESRRTVEPCNLFEALRWVVEQAGQIVAETHERIMDEAESELAALEQQADRGFWPLDYTRTLAAVDRLIAEKNLREGPHAGRAGALRQTVERKRRRQRVSLAVTAAALAASVLFGLWMTGRRVQERDYDDYARQVRENPDDDKVRDRLDQYETRVGRHRWDRFWGLASRRREADAQAAADRATLARVEASAAFARLVADDEGLARDGQHPRRHQAILDYLGRHRGATPDDRQERLRKALEDTRAAWEEDRQAWAAVSGLRIDGPAAYDSLITRLRDYARRADALSRGEAERQGALLAEQKERDQVLYDELRQSVETALTSAAIGHAEQLAQDYLGLGQRGQAMSGAVRAQQTALNRFKQPRDVSIKVKSIRVPAAFLNRTWTGNPRVALSLTVGDQTRGTSVMTTTQAGDAFVASPGESLGPFRVTWGKKQTLTAKLEVHRSVFTNETASVSLSDAVFVLNHANGTVRMTSGALGRTKVEAELACDDARPPSLPEFGGR